MTIEVTLDAALMHAAQRSFYEPTTIYPLSHPSASDTVYAVDYGVSSDPSLEESTWSYAGGLSYEATTIDDSGLMDPYEFFDNADQIRRYLPHAVQDIEDGGAVTFSYQLARNSGALYDCDGRAYDPDYRDKYVYDCEGYVSGIMMDSGELSTDIDAYMFDDVAGWFLAAERA